MSKERLDYLEGKKNRSRMFSPLDNIEYKKYTKKEIIEHIEAVGRYNKEVVGRYNKEVPEFFINLQGSFFTFRLYEIDGGGYNCEIYSELYCNSSSQQLVDEYKNMKILCNDKEVHNVDEMLELVPDGFYYKSEYLKNGELLSTSKLC